MRAAVLEQAGEPLQVVDDLEIEEPHAGEVLVRIKHCGVCASDVSIANGSFPSALPVVLGHEAAGIVEALGPGVTTLSVGDHVVLTPAAPCGNCPWCVRGQWALCINTDTMITSTHLDGGTRLSRRGATVYRGVCVAAFAELVVIPAAGAVKIPDDVPLDVACVVGCAVQTGVGAALNTADIVAGDTVLVTGAGGIGLSVVQGARIAGASRILVSDPDAGRRAAALELGATHAIDPTVDDLQQAALDLSPHGIGVDVAFEAVGRSALIAACIDATRKGGTTVIVGVPGLADPFSYPIPALLALSEKRIIGSVLGSCNSLRDIPRFIALWQSGQLDLTSMITGRRPLDDINAAFDDIRTTTGIRTVIDL